MKIYTDGSGHAWAFVIYDSSGNEFFHKTGFTNGVSPICEMQAILQALTEVRNIRNEQIEIYTDHKILYEGFNEYLPKWKAKNWVKNNGNRVKHVKLWKEIEKLVRPNVKILYVQGHSGVAGNIRAHQLANQRRKSARKNGESTSRSIQKPSSSS